MKKFLFLCAPVFVAFMGTMLVFLPQAEAAAVATSAPLQLSSNDHYYQLWVDPGGVKWFNARDAAASLTYAGVSGHLATVTSAAEESFIRNLPGFLDSFTPTQYNCCRLGPWLGAELVGDTAWQWIDESSPFAQKDGTPIDSSYTAWALDRPNWGKTQPWIDMYKDETVLGYFNTPNNTSLTDVHLGWDNHQPTGYGVLAYVVEFDMNSTPDVVPTPQPEPTTILLLGSGLVGLAGFGRKYRKK